MDNIIVASFFIFFRITPSWYNNSRLYLYTINKIIIIIFIYYFRINNTYGILVVFNKFQAMNVIDRKKGHLKL